MIVFIDLNVKMCYNLKIHGYPINFLSQMLVENYILVNSFPIASGTLNNNHNYIAYKCMRGDMSVGVDVINLAHMPGKYNPDDVLSNTTPHRYHYTCMD